MRREASNSFAQIRKKSVRAADAKEVGVGNPAEETYRYPNKILLLYLNSRTGIRIVNHLNRVTILLQPGQFLKAQSGAGL